ncbi:MAG: V4R domain-containing protein [Anaerolineales bacterium]
MEHIPKSGLYYANKFARITLEAYEKVMGENGLNAILKLAGLSDLIENYPPDNLEREFDFADFTAIHVALEEIYGARGSQILALRAGRAIFEDALKNFGALAGMEDPAFQELPLQTKISIGLPVLAKVISQFSDQQASVHETEAAFLWTIQRCPVCWSRKNAEKPVCHISTGLLQAMLHSISGGLEFHIKETKCCATGETVCEYVIQKEPIGKGEHEPSRHDTNG